MAGLALIVATRDRAAALRRLLASAVALTGLRELAPEIVVADDDSRDGTRQVVDEMARRHPAIRYRRAPGGGKTRALNDAIRATAAPLLAFVDDDVELDPSWLVAADAYFARTPVAAAQGTIRLPPEAAGNAALAAAVDLWRTVPRCDLGPDAAEVRGLIGANMFVRRAAFARLGLFDERLGPGAAGACEDTELAWRLRAAGERIGYVPDAVVYHAVSRDRLNPDYFRAMHAARGRSRVYYKRSGLATHVLPNLAVAALGVAVAAVTARPHARWRARGRWYHYRAMLAATRAPRLAGGVPPLTAPAAAAPPASSAPGPSAAAPRSAHSARGR
jgi:GT2 family glycosyltransferase